MFLAIDIGNTTISCGIFKECELSFSFSIPTKNHSELICQIPKEKIEGVCISSVVPSVTQSIIDKVKELGISPIFVTPGDIKTDLLLPSQIGQDRIANSVAAKNLYQLPVIVVDFGTATTFDVISKDGYLGGVIAPGIETSFLALINKAELLYPIELKPPRVCIGKDTEQALLSGVFYGFSAQVDGIVRRIQAELGSPALVIGTGGICQLISNFCEEIDEINPHLTLYGLMFIYTEKKCELVRNIP
ncbi:type III pantothenate kinase [bacterium]|nr:type III pantothenate kinase [bacterium]